MSQTAEFADVFETGFCKKRLDRRNSLHFSLPPGNSARQEIVELMRGGPPRTPLFGNGHARKTRIMIEAFIPRRRQARVWRRLLLGVFVMMTMTLAARGRRSGLVGDRLDRGALADLAVQPLHGLVADDDTAVGGDFLAGVRMFFPGNADRDMKRLDDHRRVGPAGKSDQGEQSHDGENTLDFHRSHLFSPSRAALHEASQ